MGECQSAHYMMKGPVMKQVGEMIQLSLMLAYVICCCTLLLWIHKFSVVTDSLGIMIFTIRDCVFSQTTLNTPIDLTVSHPDLCTFCVKINRASCLVILCHLLI